MTTLENSFLIRPLTAEDAGLVVVFLRSQPPRYIHFFYALGANESAIAEMFSASKKDVYSGVFWRGRLVGIFTLRGWDEGYEIPSYGVLIDDKYRGGTFMRLTLDTAKLICRLAGAKKMMAKMHPDNISSKVANRFGMRQTGIEESTGNLIYQMEL